jgi:epoxyqueuosine reductase
VDSRLCISYFTIESRDAIPNSVREGMGTHVFGCDLCQDVCPWNWSAPVTTDPAFQPREMAPPLAKLAGLTQEEFRTVFRDAPVTRARYSGFLRNVALAMGNAPRPEYRAALERLAALPDPMVAEQAAWSLTRVAAMTTLQTTR